MRRLCSLFAILLIVSASWCARASSVPAKAVVAYVFPENNVLQPGQIDARALTRINYAFANIANGRMVLGFAGDPQNFAFLASLKQQNPDLTVLVSVGGWLWSTNFSDVALTPESRAVFIQSVMDFLAQYKLDGLDIDWEYPGMPGAGHPFRSVDRQNFTLLLKELRARFTAETAKTHKRLYLTFAAGASDEFLANTEMEKAKQYVDTVNLMAYDYYEAGSDRVTGNHAPLFTNPGDPKKISAADSVAAFEKAGVPAAKIILGVPFYGRMWGQVPNTNHGLFQPGKPVPDSDASYAAIVSSMLNDGYDRFWDDKASVPYLYNAQKKFFVSYEDPQSIAAKCEFVVARHLGGVMFWDYSSDPSGTLLHAINNSLKKHQPGGTVKP